MHVYYHIILQTQNMFKHCFSKLNNAAESESESTTNNTAIANTTSSHNDYDENPKCQTSPLMQNFNSLYEHEPEVITADLATALASQRFFFSSPGHSNSLIEYTTSSSLVCEKNNNKNMKNMKNKKKVLLFKESVAVPTYSLDPYLDFRRSMEEMVEARPELMDVNSNWNVLNQLLLSYLALNPKTTHKFILTAFSDLLISLMDVKVSSM